MNISADISKFKIVPGPVKCWIVLKPVLGGVEGCLHLTVPSMSRLNQTESATFLIFCLALSLIISFGVPLTATNLLRHTIEGLAVILARITRQVKMQIQTFLISLFSFI
jgi:hypothetical protein